MEIFKFFHRYSFLKVCLIGMACQTQQLFSQRANSYEPYYYGDPSQSYYAPNYSQYSDGTPPNGQWPASSRNEWQDQQQSQPYYYTPNYSQYPSDGYPSNQYQNDQWHAPPDQGWQKQETPQPQTQQTISNDKQNLVTFDPNLAEAPDKEQHPLTKEGEARAYSLEEKEATQDLSQGKGNIKIVKKRSEINAASRRLEEALLQSEEVIGKQEIIEPAAAPSILSSEGHFNDQLIAQIINREELPPLTRSAPTNQTPANEQIPPIDQLSPLNQTSSANSPTNPTAPTNQTPTPAAPTTPTTFPETETLNAPTNNPQEVTAPPAAPEIQTPPRVPTVITPTTPGPEFPQVTPPVGQTKGSKEIGSINFNNVAMTEYIRFISRISNKNFVFNDEDLQFNVTIVSEEPTTVDNLMAAMLQELKIRDLSLIEQGNNIIIHRNPRVRSPARIVAGDGTEPISSRDSELVTRVFRLNTLDPVKASEIIRPLLSEDALIEVLRDSNNLIITDLVTNVNKIAQLIGTLDAPNSGVTIGQYVVRNAFVDSLVDLATKILQPIAQGNPFVLVPHPVSNSIFIVSNAFIVEKALAILQNLDMNEGRTKILSLETLQPSYPPPGGAAAGPTGSGPGGPGGAPPGVPELPLGRPPGSPESFPFGGPGAPPPPLPFGPGGISAEGRPSAIFDESRNFMPGGIAAASRWQRELPVGHIERTLFFIYKLRYRKGDNIEIALRKIANSLQVMGTANVELISAINSSQWIESSNALIFTGTSVALEKVKELILEVDVPLRQVFIEMLILNTTITDSLTYSVDWINRFGGGSTTGEEGFIGAPSPATSNFVTAGEAIPNGQTNVPIPPVPIPNFPVATGLLNDGGFAAGIIGTHLTHNGTQFSTIGALVRAIHTDSKADILLNPKIITEDNNPAEIFVGGTDRYKTQSITNDLGSLVTNNFQFIDVGTTLRVTPLIGNNGIITLEIVQETTTATADANNPLLATNADVNLVQVLNKTRTVTKVHVPNGFFVVLSGMIQDSESRTYRRIPCLGGIPILGAFGKRQDNTDLKQNLMLFIRPLIIDTDDDYEDITRRQQDVFREKCKFRRSWNYEIDEALNFGNIKSTDPDDMDCRCSDREKR